MMIPRFQHILVPVDFTPKNEAVLNVAFEMAVMNRSRVRLLHVIETVEDSDEELAQFYERLETRASAELEAYAQRFEEGGLAVDRKIRYGKRVREIVQDSAEHEIDLIIMNSHPVDPQMLPSSWASISYQVSIACPGPVLLLK